MVHILPYWNIPTCTTTTCQLFPGLSIFGILVSSPGNLGHTSQIANHFGEKQIFGNLIVDSKVSMFGDDFSAGITRAKNI